jgi:uncharacterized protein (TIGR02687 family)
VSDLKQLHAALNRHFHDEGARIVFWNDPDREFVETAPSLLLDGVTVLRLDEVGSLEAKIRLERTDTTGKYLLYSPAEEPDFEDDWLLDIRLYSRSFRADRASILLQELNLHTQSLRHHLSDRRKFFDAKDRLQKLKVLVDPKDDETALDLKMMAVVAKADQPELFNLLHTLFQSWTAFNADVDLDAEPEAWSQIEKFDLDASFWRMIRAKFGYEDDNPSLKKLLIRIMVTDFAHYSRADTPEALRGLLLPANFSSNVVVCLAQWRDSASKGASYDQLSAHVAAITKLEDHLSGMELEEIVGVPTFLAVEKAVAISLRERLESTAETVVAESIKAIATRRQSGHWASLGALDSVHAPRKALHAVYDAIVSAAEFYALRNRHKHGFDYDDATSMYRAYEKELFLFDQHYRHFCEAADTAEEKGWNIVKKLRGDIEARYVNWYMTNLSMAWGKFLEPNDGLLAKWRIDDVHNQNRFFANKVQPYLDEADNRRAFVIISDAFRYEAAEELTAELNGKYRFEAQLASQLGVLPSYTALGMASLLPHKTLAYKGADVLVDGKSSAAGARDAILQAVKGIACKAEELMAMRKDEGREFVKDKRVVYIYHNTVDAVGDSASTEGDTFGAVRRAINEIAALVGYVVNNLSGTHVVVTADHGFLFTETAPSDPDKSKLKDKPESAIVAKKRYVIGEKLGEHEGTWRGKLNATANVDGDMEFWIPRGTNLFHFVGGSRFVHGGAMPQEIVVPVITVKQVRGKGAQDTKSRNVAVQVLGVNHRITTAHCRFGIIQTEAVSDRVRPVTIRIAIYDGDKAVTGVETLKFDSASASLEDRKKWVSLVLEDGVYDKKKPYKLILRDAETGIEQQSVEVIIDRAFTDDF